MDIPWSFYRQQLAEEIRCQMQEHQAFNEEFLLLLAGARLQADAVAFAAQRQRPSLGQRLSSGWGNFEP